MMVHGLADGGAGGDDVVDDQHPARQRRADEVAALAVVLGLLAVEAYGRSRRGGRPAPPPWRRQRDALVGGAEQHVEVDGRNRRWPGRRSGPAAPAAPVLNRPALKKYGLTRPDFRVNSPKRSTPGRGEFEKGLLVILHGNDCLAGKGRYDTRFPRHGESMRIITANLNGIRSAARKGFFDWMLRRRPTWSACRRPRRRPPAGGPMFHPRGWCLISRRREEGLQRRGHLQPHAPDRVIAGWAGPTWMPRAAIWRRASASCRWCPCTCTPAPPARHASR
jgi:hypothetical protein